MQVRTDMAMEEKELWQRSAGARTVLQGVWARTKQHRGIPVTTVKILDERGSQQLHKPVGTYVTLELGSLRRREKQAFHRAVLTMAEAVEPFLQPEGSVLVVGLGNEAVTPDAVGPWALRELIVTRHLKTGFDKTLSGLRSVCALQPGVLGTTGIESVEIVRAAAEKVKPQQIIVIDALAAGDPSRVCSSVQLADTGIVPGSGVGNARAAFNQASLGVPVLAVGVPTVLDAGALLALAGGSLGRLSKDCAGMIVTPRDVDAKIQEVSRLVAYGLDLALHPGLEMGDIPGFLP